MADLVQLKKLGDELADLIELVRSQPHVGVPKVPELVNRIRETAWKALSKDAAQLQALTREQFHEFLAVARWLEDAHRKDAEAE